MLVAAAAQQWGVQPDSLRTQAGQVVAPGGKRLGYGELAEAAMKLSVPQQVALKDPKDFRLIGKATRTLDLRASRQLVGRESAAPVKPLRGPLPRRAANVAALR